MYDDPELGIEGLDAVVDKDRVAAVLGRELKAKALLILTDVDAVYRNFGTPEQERVTTLSLRDAEQLLAGSALGSGSMRPKVEAAADFVRSGGKGARAIIAELSQGLEALAGRAGTTITKENG